MRRVHLGHKHRPPGGMDLPLSRKVTGVWEWEVDLVSAVSFHVHERGKWIDLVMKITPIWVHGIDQLQLPVAKILLQPLFTLDGQFHCVVVFVLHQAREFVSGLESLESSILVVTHSVPQFTGDANIECSVHHVRHDVNGGKFLFNHGAISNMLQLSEQSSFRPPPRKRRVHLGHKHRSHRSMDPPLSRRGTVFEERPSDLDKVSAACGWRLPLSSTGHRQRCHCACRHPTCRRGSCVRVQHRVA